MISDLSVHSCPSRGLKKAQRAGSHPQSPRLADSVDLRKGQKVSLQICISNRFTSDVDIEGPGTTFGKF
jgi:hypothetical protein